MELSQNHMTIVFLADVLSLNHFRERLVLCNVPNCNTEAWMKIIEWYFSADSKKPLCKAIFLVCENHAKILSDDGIVSKIQVLH
jgi:hypothetical protein